MRVCLAVAAAVVVALLVWPSAIAQAPAPCLYLITSPPAGARGAGGP